VSVQINIPDNLFKSLQKHAIPFVDQTPVSVIERWAKYFDEQSSPTPNNVSEGPVNLHRSSDATEFDPIHPPDLFHTRARGTFGTTAFSNWNDLLRIAHIEAFKKAKSFEELRTATHAQIRKGSHSESGYRFLSEIEISLQGVDANHAWPYALRLAKYVHAPLRASIEWRNNEKAAFPGKGGILRWIP